MPTTWTYVDWLESSDGRDVDHGTTRTSLQHLGDGQLGEQEGRLHVRVENLVPLLFRALKNEKQRDAKDS